MSQKCPSLQRSLFLATVALTISAGASAHDSSMCYATGDSQASANGSERGSSLATARTPQSEAADAVPTLPKKQEGAERHMMLFGHLVKVTPTNPFRDNTGA